VKLALPVVQVTGVQHDADADRKGTRNLDKLMESEHFLQFSCLVLRGDSDLVVNATVETCGETRL
jgi:hypothetical protein